MFATLHHRQRPVLQDDSVPTVARPRHRPNASIAQAHFAVQEVHALVPRAARRSARSAAPQRDECARRARARPRAAVRQQGAEQRVSEEAGMLELLRREAGETLRLRRRV